MNRVDEVFFSQQSNSKILLVVITDMKVAKCILFSPLIAHHQSQCSPNYSTAKADMAVLTALCQSPGHSTNSSTDFQRSCFTPVVISCNLAAAVVAGAPIKRLKSRLIVCTVNIDSGI